MYFIALLAVFLPISACGQSIKSVQALAKGHLPVVVTDAHGVSFLTFGRDSTLYFAIASSGTTNFGAPTAVATLPGLVAGAKRGPQLAVTGQFVVITAVNRAGNVFAYSLDRRSGKWSSAGRINDVPDVAKEGFQAVAGASAGTFQAVWLDLRHDKQNKIAGATSRDGGRTWSANRIIYQSPDGTVCECCRVSVVASGPDVYVQFRNWLGGARNLYLTHSADGGGTFAPPQKLGVGNWTLNACPMDGGAVVISPSGQPLTTWRRENTLYTCQPGEPEQAVAAGRNVTLANTAAGPLLAWDNDGLVYIKSASKPAVSLGSGQMASVAVAGQSAICVWESDGQVMTASVAL